MVHCMVKLHILMYGTILNGRRGIVGRLEKEVMFLHNADHLSLEQAIKMVMGFEIADVMCS